MKNILDARKKFAKNSHVLSVLTEIQPFHVSALLALLDGKTISNPNYELNADLEIIRCDAIVGHLRRKYQLPIRSIRTTEDRARVYYVIDNETLQLIEQGGVEPFKMTAKERAIQRVKNENSLIDRLVRQYGRKGAIYRLANRAYKPKELSVSKRVGAVEVVESVYCGGGLL